MKRLKHSKIKNTGILFELLTRQITVDILNDTNNPNSVRLMKKYFSKDTSLGKELELYHLLVKENFKSQNKAEKFLDIVLEQKSKLSTSSLRREKYNLIKEIKKYYPLEDFFNTKVKNYKQNASIYKLFESHSENENYNPKDIYNSKTSIIEGLVSNKVVVKSNQSKLIKEYEKQDKDMRLLSYKILVEKFNKKYGNLTTPQRKLLKHFINNISNTNSLREYIESEVVKLKKVLTKMAPKVKDKITHIKLTEAIKQIDKFIIGENTKKITDKNILSLMRYYELTKELKACTSTAKVNL